MSEVAELTYSELALPANIVSKVDLSRMVAELEQVDNELTAGAVRQGLGSAAASMPALSPQLSDFVGQNKLELSEPQARAGLIRQLHQLKDAVPVIHMTFATTADTESLRQLVQWLRQSVHPQAVIAAGLQPGLVAGVYVRTNNQVFDLSMRGALQKGRGILVEELGALRGSR